MRDSRENKPNIKTIDLLEKILGILRLWIGKEQHVLGKLYCVLKFSEPVLTD